MEEILRLHQSLSAAERRQQVLNLLAKVGLSHPEQRFDQYPHQLSGGMKQRVLIAIAIALQPDLIIADEPTSALDVTVQKRILDLLDILRRESGTAVLFVTHDLALAAERADRIMVFRQGEIQEQGATETIVQRPQHPYTRQLLHDLLDAPLGLTAARHRPLATPAIRVEGISKRFSLGKQALQALDSVSFEVRRGSTHALVGESGSGKPPWRGSCWALSAPTPDRSPSTVSTPGISAARHSVSCGARSSLSTRTPSLRSTRARRCLRLSKSR
ncbi:ABC transporter ATP-binding protein [Klebsiella pneumoniae]|uniref:ABC transporter ATP-binding protein n=1 Tax=Klebsiella pneumoniae TaxID=573 RepID=A0A2X3E6B9_KLEPN|nr:ABC transporter ATP-binding protein [Klebsiella pneumoniae]